VLATCKRDIAPKEYAAMTQSIRSLATAVRQDARAIALVR
jgi:hypothetical protein